MTTPATAIPLTTPTPEPPPTRRRRASTPDYPDYTEVDLSALTIPSFSANPELLEMSADRPPSFRTPAWYREISGVHVINGAPKPGYRSRYEARFGTVEENRRKRCGRGRVKREAAREGVVEEGEWGWGFEGRGLEGRVKREDVKKEEVKREGWATRLFGEGGSQLKPIRLSTTPTPSLDHERASSKSTIDNTYPTRHPSTPTRPPTRRPNLSTNATAILIADSDDETDSHSPVSNQNRYLTPPPTNPRQRGVIDPEILGMPVVQPVFRVRKRGVEVGEMGGEEGGDGFGGGGLKRVCLVGREGVRTVVGVVGGMVDWEGVAGSVGGSVEEVKRVWEEGVVKALGES